MLHNRWRRTGHSTDTVSESGVLINHHSQGSVNECTLRGKYVDDAPEGDWNRFAGAVALWYAMNTDR